LVMVKHMIKSGKKEFGNLEVIVLVILTCVISVGMTICWDYKFGLLGEKETKDDSNEFIALTDEMKKFIDNYNYFVENYYGKVNEKKLLEEAFKAITEASGDEFTEYFDETQIERFNISLDGYFTGIGVEISHDGTSDYVSIFSVFPDSPASKAGLLKGDKLLEINDIDVKGKTTLEVRNIIRDSKDDNFVIKYERDGNTATVNVKRGNINIQSVHPSMMDEKKKIGYIKVDIFATNTDEQFNKALSDLENNGMKSLIIDLRGNSGGHLNVVTDMVSRFLKNDKLIYQIVSKEGTEKVYSKGLIDKKYPIVILVNGASASASELMSATLREQSGAILVGTTTYGKSTIQEVKEYSDNTEYKLTTREWLTPEGKRLNKVGLKPDYEVILSEEYYNNPTTENDNQLIKALEILNK